MTRALKYERERRGWKLAYVAQQIGVHYTTIQKIEEGLRDPSYSVLLKLEALYGKQHTELFAEVQDKESN